MEIWYVFLNMIFAVWVLVDGFRREINAIPWSIGTALFGPIVFPVYVARRPRKTGEDRKDNRTGWNRLNNFAYFGIIVFWTILLTAAGIWKDKSATSASEESPEYKLAVLNTKQYIHQDDDTTVRFHSLLDQLAEHYVEDRQQIVNISIIAHKRLKACGVRDKSMMDIMEGMNKVFGYSGLKNQKYAEYASLYVRLRSGGQSHKEAVEGLQALVRGY
ncbi:MAG: hypothetical protein AB1847_04660 [bacterium]